MFTSPSAKPAWKGQKSTGVGCHCLHMKVLKHPFTHKNMMTNLFQHKDSVI